jgi:hypothetical protein
MRNRSTLIAGLLLSGLMTASVFGQQILEKETGLYTTPEIKTQAAISEQDVLVIKSALSLSGSLDIEAGNQKNIVLTYSKQARADSRSKGVDYIDLISVSLDKVADQVRLELRAPNPGPWNKETEAGVVAAVLTVPLGCRIEIDAQQYDVTARGPLRSLTIRSSLGKLDIAKVTEKLDVATANRRVILEDIAGDISAATTNATIQGRTIVGSGGPVRLRNEGGDIKIDGIIGAVNVKNNFGRIDITNFEPRGEASFVRGSSGPISLAIKQMGKARLVVKNEYEDMEITVPDSISAVFSLAVDADGTVEATNFTFKTDLVERDRLNLHTRDGLAEINGMIRGKGNIYVRGVKGE